MYFPRFLDEDAVEDSGVTISATLDTTALYSTSPSEENFIFRRRW